MSVDNSENISANEIDEETSKKLKGDAIGNTMYSEVFVIKTLMQFSNLQWNEEVENDLCFLWDMTDDQDVCECLLKLSFPELACHALVNYTEPRFVEIVIGIFANILCSKCEKNLKDEEIEIVLNWLNSDDHLILIQVMRFIQAVSFLYESLHVIDDQHYNKIIFILDNSTNQDLLEISLKATAAITDDLKLKPNVINAELLNASVMAFKTCREQNTDSGEMEQYEARVIQKNIKPLTSIAYNICEYYQNFRLNDISNNLKIPECVKEFNYLLTMYTHEEYLLPIDETSMFYISRITYVCRILIERHCVHFIPPLCLILKLVAENSESDEAFECCAELLCYIISQKYAEFQDFTNFKFVLSEIKKRQPIYTFQYLESLNTIIENV